MLFESRTGVSFYSDCDISPGHTGSLQVIQLKGLEIPYLGYVFDSRIIVVQVVPDSLTVNNGVAVIFVSAVAEVQSAHEEYLRINEDHFFVVGPVVDYISGMSDNLDVFLLLKPKFHELGVHV